MIAFALSKVTGIDLEVSDPNISRRNRLFLPIAISALSNSFVFPHSPRTEFNKFSETSGPAGYRSTSSKNLLIVPYFSLSEILG